MNREGDGDEAARLRSAIARALVERGFEDVLVIDRETAAELLTLDRRELLDRLSGSSGTSISELADDLDQDQDDIRRDVELLFANDVVEWEEDGEQEALRLKHSWVVAEPLVYSSLSESS